MCIKACLMCLSGTRAKAHCNYISGDFGLHTIESSLGSSKVWDLLNEIFNIVVVMYYIYL